MILTRRAWLNSIIALCAFGLSRFGRTQTLGLNTLTNDKLDQAIKQETGGNALVDSGQIILQAPEIAEDGAVVPISLETSLPNVETLWVFVEKNPTPLAARFELDPALDALVSLRIKMNESCDIIAVVKSGGVYFSSRKSVRVVLGGCG